MTFKEIEEIRKAKGIYKWEMAWMLGLRPSKKAKTPRIQFCSSSYEMLRKGRRKITVRIIAAAERLQALKSWEIVKELK